QYLSILETYAISLHDALPLSTTRSRKGARGDNEYRRRLGPDPTERLGISSAPPVSSQEGRGHPRRVYRTRHYRRVECLPPRPDRSEEHTSELQSRLELV